MAQIRQYNSQVRSPGPVQSRRLDNSDVAPIGRAISELGNTITNAAKTIEQRDGQDEVSGLTAKMAENHAQYTNKLRDNLRTADPSDRELTNKFLADYDQNMEKMSEGVQTVAGRQYFNERRSQMRSHFLESAATGQAELAGIKSTEDYNSSLNNFTSSLINDPSSFDLASDMMNKDLEARVNSGMLPREAALKLKSYSERELAQSAIRGWADVNPEYAKKQLESKRWDKHLGGDLKNQLYGEIDQSIRAKEIEGERFKRLQEEAKQAKIFETQNNFLEKMVSGELDTKSILKSDLPAFGSGSKEQFLKMMKSNALTKPSTNYAVYNELFDRIHAEEGDPRKITDENDLNEYMGSGLNMSSLRQLRQEMQGYGTEEGKAETKLRKGIDDIAKSRLTKSDPLTGLMDPTGAENLQRWRAEFNKEFQEQRKAGKTPQQLLNPDSPDYLGKTIQNYVRTPDQILKDMTKGIKKSATPTAAPRKQGETAADYIKRTKAKS